MSTPPPLPHMLPARNSISRSKPRGTCTAEEDAALRIIVDREGEGRWIAKARELRAKLTPFYKRLTAAAIARGETPVTYGRIAAQCLHRFVVFFFFFLYTVIFPHLPEDEKMKANVYRHIIYTCEFNTPLPIQQFMKMFRGDGR